MDEKIIGLIEDIGNVVQEREIKAMFTLAL